MTGPGKLAIASAIAALAAAGAAGANAWHERGRASPRRGLLSGAVAFTLPERWSVQGWLAERGSEGVAAYIPCAPLDETPHSANANLLAESNGDAEGLASWSARRLAVAAPRRIEEERVEGAWRTVVSTGVDRGARYVVVERFGVSSRARVHAIAAFPALAGVPESWFEWTGGEIDRFLRSLALAGAPPSSVRVGWDGRTIRLAMAGGP